MLFHIYPLIHKSNIDRLKNLSIHCVCHLFTKVGGGGGDLDTESVLPNRIMKVELQEKNCSLH